MTTNNLFSGVVISGDGIGARMGFPTINLSVFPLPSSGVFAVMAFWREKKYFGLGHFGPRPTFGKTEFRVEIHLFDFSEKVLAGEKFLFSPVEKIRGGRAFKNTADLIAQIENDVVAGRVIFERKRKGLFFS